MYDRYADVEKFITDPDKLQITNGSEVYISSEDNYDIVVDLQGHTEDFEQLKPFISFVAKNICKLDNIAQKFDNLHSKSGQFPYVVAIVFIDDPFIILEYWERKKTRNLMWFLSAEMTNLRSKVLGQYRTFQKTGKKQCLLILLNRKTVQRKTSCRS